MPRYIDLDKQLVRLYLLNVTCEDVIKNFLLSAEFVDVPEKKVGKWTEKEVIHAKEAKAIIPEWQSCKCSVCGCYDTRPYLYCFNKPRFCSWCGAEMKGVSDE